MSRPLEYTVAIDSRNRDRQQYPEPNDFSLDINFSRGLPITRMYMGSIELPLPQQTVEEEWSRLYFDEGTTFIVNSEEDLCLRTLTIQEFDGSIVESIIPIWLNPIIDVDISDPLAPIFTTAFDHALELRGFWNWGTPIRLISTDLTDPTFIDLTINNNNLSILSPTEFQISGLAVPFVPSGNPFGYVHAPAIANPAVLAEIITGGFDAVVPNRYQVLFDPFCGRFCIRMRSLTCNILLAPDQRYDQDHFVSATAAPATLIVGGDNCLASVLGFGCTNIPFPLGQEAVYKGICGQFEFRCMSCIRITPAFYVQAPNFAAEIQIQTNRLFFDCPCAGLPAEMQPAPPMFVFSDSCGSCYVITLPCGRYTPDTFAMALQDAMNTSGTMNTYSVTFQVTSSSASNNKLVGLLTGSFVFASTDGSSFGLEFDDPRNNLSTRLGFTSICYRGQNSYKSETLYIPLKGCDCTTMPLRFIENVYSPFIRSSMKRLGIQSCKARPLNLTTALATTLVGDEVLRITTNMAAVPVAHGYQPEDVINITVNNVIYQVRVISVIDAFSFDVEIGGIAALLSLANEPVCTSLFGPVILNLYFSEDCGHYSMRSELTGFPPQAILWTGPDYLPAIAPNQFSLDPPDYLLIEFEKPNESTYIQHQWKNDVKNRIFGKIVIYPGYRMERMFPIEAVFQGMKIINQLQIRILTPQHELYNFHGRDWSMTLVFVVAGQTGNQLCY